MADPQVPLRVLHEAEHRLRRHIGSLQGIEDCKKRTPSKRANPPAVPIQR
jgi:hypothetical protein